LGGPIAIGIAILRYRLYEIDTLINRTLAYGSLTGMLVANYFGVVATAQEIFRVLTGQAEQSQLAIVVSTLVIAVLFSPLRRRTQLGVSTAARTMPQRPWKPSPRSCVTGRTWMR